MSSDSTPSERPTKVTQEKPILTNLTVIAMICVGVWVVSREWNKKDYDSVSMSSSIAQHSAQIESLKTELITIRAEQYSQTTLLRYLANGRQGPIPEAAKN